METITNILTGEIINVVDADDSQVAQLYIDLNKVLKATEEQVKALRNHIEERVTETNMNFGDKNIKVEYIRFKDWRVPEEIEKQIEEKQIAIKALSTEAKNLFDDNKVDAGTAKVQLKVTLPKF